MHFWTRPFPKSFFLKVSVNFCFVCTICHPRRFSFVLHLEKWLTLITCGLIIRRFPAFPLSYLSRASMLCWLLIWKDVWICLIWFSFFFLLPFVFDSFWLSLLADLVRNLVRHLLTIVVLTSLSYSSFCFLLSVKWIIHWLDAFIFNQPLPSSPPYSPSFCPLSLVRSSSDTSFSDAST